MPNENPADPIDRVYAACTDQWKDFAGIAEELDEVPWDVNRECHALAALGKLEEGNSALRGCFAGVLFTRNDQYLCSQFAPNFVRSIRGNTPHSARDREVSIRAAN